MLEGFIATVNRWTRSLTGNGSTPVYDIINAGPRHRFACSGVVVSNCASDFGIGFDKNIILQTRYALPVVQIQLCHQNSLMVYNPFMGQYPRWMVDKTTALDLMFMSIKYGNVRFPSDPIFRQEYAPDLLSPYEEVTDHGGLTTRRYLRNPARPDDFAMSLCFAMMVAMKMKRGDITDMIPRGAFPLKVSAPKIVSVDPDEITKALNS